VSGTHPGHNGFVQDTAGQVWHSRGMNFALALIAALAQDTSHARDAGLPPTPVNEIVVSPAHATVTVGDSLQLTATALGHDGRPIPGVQIRWFQQTIELYNASIDSSGVFRAGGPGTVAIRAIATLPGVRPSAPTTTLVHIVPGPPARVEVTPAIRHLLVGQQIVLSGTAYAATGDVCPEEVHWRSSAPNILRVTADGHVTALGSGQAIITASSAPANVQMTVVVAPNTIRHLEITGGGSTDPRTGDVLRFGVVARDAAGREISGLTAQWTMAPGEGIIDPDGTFVAYEPGRYLLSATIGAAAATVTVHVHHRDVRRRTTTVGRLPIPHFSAAEFWPHPNGHNAYYTTLADRLYALDVSDPAHPRITDSLVVDARLINDVMTTPDGQYGAFSREGASNRRNGIVIVSFADPAHPKPIAEYTETVTGGVHSAFVYQQPKFGTDVYLTDDATGSMRVIAIDDPYHPKEIARWQTPRAPAGRYLHDIDIYDGLAYLSYWHDGLVILDVGNGMAGGSPTHPAFVSQYTYDLNDLYRHVEVEGGPGFVHGTHTAWRQRDGGRYVFVGDEVFSFTPIGIAIPDKNRGKANGRLHVIDVSDVRHPREVAWFEPPDGGSHNMWAAGDTLYMGDYQGGLRILDISGELRGDLLAEDREIAHVHTGDAAGFVPNAAMAWGAFYLNGLVWVNDIFSGLWSIRVEPGAP
jgi:hypothetical protein